LYKFLKKFGLDHIAKSTQALPVGQTLAAAATPPTPPSPAASVPDPSEPDQPQPAQSTGLAEADLPGQILLPGPDLVEALIGSAVPAPPFSSDERSTPAPSC
jgi:hypothetical protein